VKTEYETIANHYAEAVLELALEQKNEAGLEETIAKDLFLVSQTITDTPDLRLILQHPSVPGPEKKNMLLLLFRTKVNDLTLRLVELLTDKRRLDLLPHISGTYKNLLNARKQIVTAKLTSADKLNDKALADIKARLTEHLGKKLELDVAVDPVLIGGFVLRLGDQVIDGSLRGKLRAIEKTLLSV